MTTSDHTSAQTDPQTKTYYRTTYVDQDNRRMATDNKVRCIRCYKIIKDQTRSRQVHLVDGGPFALHPEDEAAYRKHGNPMADMGWWDIGLDCAKKIGLEFTSPSAAS